MRPSVSPPGTDWARSQSQAPPPATAEAAAARGVLAQFSTVVVSEEARLAYDRVNLSKWFEGMSDANSPVVENAETQELALEVAEYAYVMERGHIALEGQSASVKSDPQLHHEKFDLA